MSIRKRLLLWLLCALFVVLALAGTGIYLQIREQVRVMQDYEMRQIALSLRDQERPSAREAKDPDDHEELDFVAQIWSDDGKLLYTSEPGQVLPRLTKTGFTELDLPQDRWRFYSLLSGSRMIQIAQPGSARQEAATEMALQSLVPLFAIAPIVVLLVWVAVGRGLGPLRKVARDLEQREAALLTPLGTETLPAEILPLVTALNALLARLAESFAAQRRFLADAAHELRTPLAAVGLQAQIVERSQERAERAEAIRELRGGIDRASHLVQQLLTLARLEPESPERPFVVVKLDRLVREVVASMAALAEAKRMDLGIERSEPLRIMGDPETLKVLVENLVDNAIRYTPALGKIDLRIRAKEGAAALEIQDSGPGIPVEERERVFERFYRRSGQTEPGSGLGLAIAKGIVERHHARIELRDGAGSRGLVVSIAFPTQGSKDA